MQYENSNYQEPSIYKIAAANGITLAGFAWLLSILSVEDHNQVVQSVWKGTKIGSLIGISAAAIPAVLYFSIPKERCDTPNPVLNIAVDISVVMFKNFSLSLMFTLPVVGTTYGAAAGGVYGMTKIFSKF